MNGGTLEPLRAENQVNELIEGFPHRPDAHQLAPGRLAGSPIHVRRRHHDAA